MTSSSSSSSSSSSHSGSSARVNVQQNIIYPAQVVEQTTVTGPTYSTTTRTVNTGLTQGATGAYGTSYTTGAQGYTTGAQGYTTGAQGYTTGAQGYTSGAQGYTSGAQGYSTTTGQASQGYTTGAQGYTTTVGQGYTSQAARGAVTSGHYTASSGNVYTGATAMSAGQAVVGERVYSTGGQYAYGQERVITGEQRVLTGQERVISETTRTVEGETRILSERVVEHEIKVPKKIVREEIIERVVVVPERTTREEVVEESQTVREKIIEVAKPVIQEKIVEVPVTEYVDKIIEVPEVVVQEKVREVERVEYKDRIIEVPRVEVVDRVVEVPEVEYVEVQVEKIVQQVGASQIVQKFVEVPQYVDKPVPRHVDVEVPVVVERAIPVPVEAVVIYEYQLPKLTTRARKMTYPLYIPRFIEVAIPEEALEGFVLDQMKQLNQHVQVVTSQASPSLCVIEQVASDLKKHDHSRYAGDVNLTEQIVGAMQARGANAMTTTATTTTTTHMGAPDMMIVSDAGHYNTIPAQHTTRYGSKVSKHSHKRRH